jgi:nitrogen fixation/metabolism regulation signal transduction histidine kinase
MRIRTPLALLTALAVSLAVPAAALADESHAGEGLAGELNDKIITFFSLGVLLFFVLVIVVGTMIQSSLEKKKDAQKKAKMRQRVGW